MEHEGILHGLKDPRPIHLGTNKGVMHWEGNNPMRHQLEHHTLSDLGVQILEPGSNACVEMLGDRGMMAKEFLDNTIELLALYSLLWEKNGVLSHLGSDRFEGCGLVGGIEGTQKDQFQVVPKLRACVLIRVLNVADALLGVQELDVQTAVVEFNRALTVYENEPPKSSGDVLPPGAKESTALIEAPVVEDSVELFSAQIETLRNQIIIYSQPYVGSIQDLVELSDILPHLNDLRSVFVVHELLFALLILGGLEDDQLPFLAIPDHSGNHLALAFNEVYEFWRRSHP